jgi:serine/threonine-protein kinase HipA
MSYPKKINVIFDGQNGRLPVGTLEMHKPGEPLFTYAPEWLAGGFEISPLRWRRQVETFPANPVEGMFGVPGFIWDSLPDSFGQQVMAEKINTAGIESPTVLEMLAVVGNDGGGALVYEPVAEWAAEINVPISKITLGKLAREAYRIFLGERVVISELLQQEGSSLGGARPKMRICIASDDTLHGSTNPPPGAEHWIVKFDNLRQPGEAAVEHAYALMAKETGMTVPVTRLLEARTETGAALINFAVKRFDRVGVTGKIFYHSMSGLLNRPSRTARGDYSELMMLLNALQTDISDREELVRRCLFNFATSNRDDHFKNFGLLFDESTGQWRLSPAFDITFINPRLNWVVECGGRASRLYGEAEMSREGIFRLCRAGNLSQATGRRLIEEVLQAVKCWGDFAAKAGVRASRQKEVAKVIERECARFL